MTRLRGVRAMRISFSLIVLALTAGVAPAQSDRGTLKSSVSTLKAHRGEIVTWKLRVEPKPNFHTYPTVQPPDAEEPDVVTKVYRPKYGPFVFVGDVVSPHGRLGMSQGKRVELIEEPAEWEWRFIVHPDAKPGKYSIELKGTVPI